MYHFFVEPHQIGTEEIRIEGADVNHIRGRGDPDQQP